MTNLERLEQLFACDWATIYVGWRGVGVYSPWPEDWEKFPPLLTVAELSTFCEGAVGRAEGKLLVRLSELMEELCLAGCSRVSIMTCLENLAGSLDKVSADLEMRKWRCATLMNLINDFHDVDVFTCARDIDEAIIEFGSLGGAFGNVRDDVWSEKATVRYDEKHCAARIEKCRKLLDVEIVLIRKCLGGTP